MVWEKLGGSALVMGHMARLIFGFVMLGAVVSVVLGIIAIYGYTRVKSGKIQNGGLIAIIAGIVMLASTHWVMGIITLVGGILCYTWRPETMPSQPQV
jgi:hypothetical protein